MSCKDALFGEADKVIAWLKKTKPWMIRIDIYQTIPVFVDDLLIAVKGHFPVSADHTIGTRIAKLPLNCMIVNKGICILSIVL